MPTIQRGNDTFIMDLIGKDTSNGLAILINSCRLYLQAITVANITTPDDVSLDKKDSYGKTNKSYKSTLE